MSIYYGPSETIKNIISLFYTKIFYKKARLIRMPIYMRGKQYLQYDTGLTTGYRCRIELISTESKNEKLLYIGKNCKMGDYVHIASGENISIGDNCLIASKVYISDISHGNYSGNKEVSSPTSSPDRRKLSTRPITIGNNVWIGENVCILPGVNIGDGVTIGANAVVNKDIPDNCIVAGVPAKIIKRYNTVLGIWENE